MKRRITVAQDTRLTIEEAFKEFITEKKALHKASKTMQGYADNFRRWANFLDEQGRSKYIADVDASFIVSYTAQCIDREMNPISINCYLRHIRAFVYWCADKEYTKPIKIKLISEQEPIKKTYSEKEKLLLIRHPADSDSFVDWRTWAIVNWVLATGNRAGTVRNILMDDINFSESEIFIRKTKANKSMILPMSPALKKVMKEFIRKWRADASETDYLFPNVGNKPISENALWDSYAKYCRDRGVKNTSIHAMRHTFAKDYIRNNGDVFRLQKILGHSTLEMTRRYVNMFSEDLKEDYERFSPLDTLKIPGNREQAIHRTDK